MTPSTSPTKTATFSILGAPRTKKTSNRIIQIKAKGGGRGFTKILPSEAHEAWFKDALFQAPAIRQRLSAMGLELPILGSICVSATFYRERNAGDLLGFAQALADWMQEPKMLPSGKQSRAGAGIIRDDVQIIAWDGSRLSKDASCPRIDVSLQVVG